jgi:hypothetical protein
MKILPLAALLLCLFSIGCVAPIMPSAAPNVSPTPVSTTLPESLGAGFRFSTYGVRSNPGPQYWLSVGQRMSAKFPGSHPETIWIVGNFMGQGKTYLSFQAKTDDPNITSGYVDMNEETLKLFDENSVKVWLQVEPGDADMLTLINLVLSQYKHHPSVIGFGVDVEWYQSDGSAEGTPISDKEAEAWVAAIRAHNPEYRLFLKHWDENWMPPTARDGIVFINDSQQFSSFEHMNQEFAAWGSHFAPAAVGYQYGYLADKDWWKNLADPAAEIGKAILAKSPNTVSLFWVDFTVLDVFPPK